MISRQRISQMLDYKLTFRLTHSITMKHALVIAGGFALLSITVTYLLASRLFGFEPDDVFASRVATLQAGAHDSSSRIELGLAYYLNGQEQLAKELFQSILRTEPANSGANIYYGMILADQQHYGEAVTHLEKGVAAEPDREPLAFLYLGQSCYYQGDWAKAIQKKLFQVVEIGIVISAAVVVYMAIAKLLRMEEVDSVLGILMRRFGRRKAIA